MAFDPIPELEEQSPDGMGIKSSTIVQNKNTGEKKVLDAGFAQPGTFNQTFQSRRQAEASEFLDRTQGGGSASGSGALSGGGPGSNLEGVADLINQQADEAIARLGKGLERSQQQIQQGFTARGLRRSGLAAGAVSDLQQQAQQKQRSIERERLGRLSELGREAIQRRAQFRLQQEQLDQQQGELGAGGVARPTRDRDQREGKIFGPNIVAGTDPGTGEISQGGGDDLEPKQTVDSPTIEEDAAAAATGFGAGPVGQALAGITPGT